MTIAAYWYKTISTLINFLTSMVNMKLKTENIRVIVFILKSDWAPMMCHDLIVL